MPETDPGVWFRFFQFGATYGALGLILVYLLIALTGFKGQPGESRAGLILAAVIGSAATIAATFGTIYKAPSIYALDRVWWLTAIWVVLGVGVMAVLGSRGVFRGSTTAQTRAAEGA